MRSEKCNETGDAQKATLFTLRGFRLTQEAMFPDGKVSGIRSYYFQIFVLKRFPIEDQFVET